MEDEIAAQTSNYIYIRSEVHAWIPGRLLESNIDDGTAVVSIPKFKEEQEMQSLEHKRTQRQEKRTIQLKDYPNNLPLQNVDERGNLNAVCDMVDLPFLHEVRINKYGIFIYIGCCYCSNTLQTFHSNFGTHTHSQSLL